ncbi:MAG: relaxase MobL [Cetobacterium sp.]|nr:relaxase MobL [Cetobacterium sp.]
MNVIQLYSAYLDKSFEPFLNHILRYSKGTYLFNDTKNRLKKSDIEEIKNSFYKTYINRTAIHQDVFVLDKKYLAKYELYSYITKSVDNNKLMEIVRSTMEDVICSKNLVWVAYIKNDYNNVKIHIGSCNPKLKYRKKSKPSEEIRYMKSIFVQYIEESNNENEIDNISI